MRRTGSGVVLETEAVRDSGSDGIDILERSSQLNANRIFADVAVDVPRQEMDGDAD